MAAAYAKGDVQRARIRLGLLLGLLESGIAPKTAFRLPGLIRKKALQCGD